MALNDKKKAPNGKNLKGNAKNKNKAPVKLTKRTMNFVHHKSSFNPMKVVPVILVLAIAIGVFVKIGFLDQLDKKAAAYNQLATKQEQLAAVQSRLADYDELENLYGRYSYGWMNKTEVSLVNRMDVLALVEEKITPVAHVENITVNNNVLTMNIFGITLEQASSMVNQLESSELVRSASVYSASAQDGKEARIFISITLTKPVSGEEAN